MSLSANSEHINGYRWRLAAVLAVLLSVIVFPLPVYSSPAIQLVTDTDYATAGYFRLSWSMPKKNQRQIQFELQQLQQNNTTSSRTIYLGTDTARLISGKQNGNYIYRVRAIENGETVTAWSNTVEIHVRHHSLIKAFAFFIVGAIVFLMTLIFIMRQRPQ